MLIERVNVWITIVMNTEAVRKVVIRGVKSVMLGVIAGGFSVSGLKQLTEYSGWCTIQCGASIIGYCHE